MTRFIMTAQMLSLKITSAVKVLKLILAVAGFDCWHSWLTSANLPLREAFVKAIRKY